MELNSESNLNIENDNDHEKNFESLNLSENLIKGASGQAVQNMNLLYKFPEQLGLK